MGDVIPNTTYPSVPGSEIVYFRVKDPAGKNNNLTLVNYQSFGSNGKRIDPTKVKRAVIIVHGLNRDAGTYMSNVSCSLVLVLGNRVLSTMYVSSGPSEFGFVVPNVVDLRVDVVVACGPLVIVLSEGVFSGSLTAMESV